jgi:hypothetical protein
MKRVLLAKTSFCAVALAAVSMGAPLALAIDFEGVRPAAFTLPEVHASVQPAAGGDPYRIDLGFGIAQINTEPAYLDTGTSGIVISNFVAENWTRNNMPIPRDPVTKFYDVTLGGLVEFDVTEPLNVRIASSTASGVEIVSQYEQVYNQAYGPMRMQVSQPTGGGLFDISPNVFGMPVMMGKTVVIDPRVYL